MPIDDLTMQTLFVRVFSRQLEPNYEANEKSDSYFVAPAPEMSANMTLAQIKMGQGSILAALREISEGKSDTYMSGIIAELEAIINDPEIDLSKAKDRAPRLLDFVYPVF